MSEELDFQNYCFGQEFEVHCQNGNKKSKGNRKFSENIYIDEKRVNSSNAAARKSSCDPIDFKVKYKTEICKYWKQQGSCPFLEQCAFAHGTLEIRNKTHLPQNYKTKKCKNFFENGFCPYGARCQFLHYNIDSSSSQVPQILEDEAQEGQHQAENQTDNSEKGDQNQKQSTPLKYEEHLKFLDKLWDENTLTFQSPKLYTRPRLATFESITSASPSEILNQNQQVIINENEEDYQKNDDSEEQDDNINNMPQFRKQTKTRYFNINAKEFDFSRSQSPLTSNTTNNPESVEEIQI